MVPGFLKREKVEPEPDKPRYMQTVPWVGYRLIE